MYASPPVNAHIMKCTRCISALKVNKLHLSSIMIYFYNPGCIDMTFMTTAGGSNMFGKATRVSLQQMVIFQVLIRSVYS